MTSRCAFLIAMRRSIPWCVVVCHGPSVNTFGVHSRGQSFLMLVFWDESFSLRVIHHW